MKLGFGEIERALQEMHDVPVARHSSFRARLRYLQQRVDLGIPRSGVGRRSNFGVEHALLFALALEFEQFGMSPEQVAGAIAARPGSFDLREAAAGTLDRMTTERPALLLWFIPEALSDPNGPNLAWASLHCSEASEIPEHLFTARSRASRLAIINMSALVDLLLSRLGDDRGAANQALWVWANSKEGE